MNPQDANAKELLKHYAFNTINNYLTHNMFALIQKLFTLKDGNLI